MTGRSYFGLMKQSGALPPLLAAAIKQETRGEVVRWIGRPKARTAFLQTLPIWLMGVPWSALMFTIFGVLVLSVTADVPSTRTIPTGEYIAMGAVLIFAGAFVLVGAGMLLAPFWAAWKARRTAHIITDRRLLTITQGRSITVKSVPPDQLRTFERTERPDGHGSLKIVTGYAKDSDGDRVEQSEHLLGVASVSEAERLLVALRDGRR
ncbi:MAG: hypothetical protein ACT4N2_10625 [Hyphomicrobium sp.]